MTSTRKIIFFFYRGILIISCFFSRLPNDDIGNEWIECVNYKSMNETSRVFTNEKSYVILIYSLNKNVLPELIREIKYYYYYYI